MPGHRRHDKGDRHDGHRHSGHRRRAYKGHKWSYTSSDISGKHSMWISTAELSTDTRVSADYEIMPIIERDRGPSSAFMRSGGHEGILGPMKWAGDALIKGINKMVGDDSRKSGRTKPRRRSYHHSERLPAETQSVTTRYAPDHRPRELDISPEHGNRMVIATFDKRTPGGGYMTSSKRPHGRKRKVYYSNVEGPMRRREPIRSHRLQRPPPRRRLVSTSRLDEAEVWLMLLALLMIDRARRPV